MSIMGTLTRYEYGTDISYFADENNGHTAMKATRPIYRIQKVKEHEHNENACRE